MDVRVNKNKTPKYEQTQHTELILKSCASIVSHATYVDESCHTCGRVMSHIWTSHVTHVDESCHICGRVMSHMRIHHMTHMNESFHTYE